MSGRTVVQLHVDQIRLSPKKQRKLHPAKVAQYQRDYEAGDVFPPIEVRNCGDFYVIREGRHRYISQCRAGFWFVDAQVVS